MHIDDVITSSFSKPPQLQVSTEEDLILVRLEGDYTLDAAQYVHQFIEQIGIKYGYRLHLIDVHTAGTITREARSFLLERRRASNAPSAVAIVGANFAVRTLAHAVIRALQLLTTTHVGVDFFADEMTARAWINSQRNKFRAMVALNR